jgi:hypothetical protein
VNAYCMTTLNHFWVAMTENVDWTWTQYRVVKDCQSEFYSLNIVADIQTSFPLQEQMQYSDS